MKHKINLTICLLLLWQLIAVEVNKDVIVPYPIDTITRMGQLLWERRFYETIFITLSHVVIVSALSAIIAFLLAYLGYQKPVVDEYVSPILSLLQAIPNISFIIIVLIWASSLQTVYIVLFLVIFPLLYHNFMAGFKNIDHDLKDVITLYQPPFLEKLFKVYLSLIKPSFLSGMKSALSLGVKVAVMAEILAGLPYGVGRVINYARSSQFDMTEVFAWTLWLVIMIMIIEYGLKKLIRDE